MLVDNSQKELELLKNSLLLGYQRFKGVYESENLPDYIEIREKIFDDYKECDTEKNANEIVQLIGDVQTYLVIDLFLTEAEHDKSYDREDILDTHSGFKLAKCIKEKNCGVLGISLMSKQFPGENRQNEIFGRLIEKPIYKGSSASNPLLMETEILTNPNMCSEQYGLPNSLDTIKVLEAFQNIIYYKAVNG